MKDCVSLEIAKKLKEAGWPQAIYQPINRFSHRNNTHFYVPFSGDAEIWPLVRREDWKEALKDNSIDGFIAAPTIAELLGALPKELKAKMTRRLMLISDGNGWEARYQGNRIASPSADAPNPADALAMLWMALKEKNLV